MLNNVTVSSGHVLAPEIRDPVQDNVEFGAPREEVVQGYLVTHGFISVGRGIFIHTVSAGPTTGPLVRFETTNSILEKQYSTRI